MTDSGWKGSSGFSAWTTAEEVTQGIDGTGLTAIVTGASSGIGKETARVLALRGVHVVMAVRNMDSGRDVKAAIINEIKGAEIDAMELDLSSMASVRKFASEYISLGLPLNLLINNAGVMTSKTGLSKDNIEIHFATNHLGHFLLTNLLLETMENTARKSKREGRIVNVSSCCHAHDFFEPLRFDETNEKPGKHPRLAYVRSKLANVLHANELARRFKESGVDIIANSLHPGCIYTNILRDDGLLKGIFSMANKYFLKTVAQGSATTCYVALHPQVKNVSGEYFADCNIAKQSSRAKDAELAKKLWDYSLTLTNTK